MLAAMRGDDAVVKCLLQLGANPAAVNADGKSATQLADEKGAAYDKRQSKVYTLIYSEERSKAYHTTQQMLKSGVPAASIDQVLAETEALVKAAKEDSAPPAEEE
jgi:hypothetical protein